MSKFGQYNINLKEIADDKVQIFKYNLDDDFFAKIDSVEVKKRQCPGKCSRPKKTIDL